MAIGTSPVLKLSFDGHPIYDGPYLLDSISSKLIEHILGKGDSLPVDLEAQELSLWRTIKPQAARYMRRIGNEQLDIEMQVRNFMVVLHQHLAITREPDPLTVVVNFIMNESFQLRPVLLVQAGNVVSVDIAEVGFDHDNLPVLLQGPCRRTGRGGVPWPRIASLETTWLRQPIFAVSRSRALRLA